MKKLMVANWKSNKNMTEVKQWFETFTSEVKMRVAADSLAWQIVVAPPMPFLPVAAEFIQAPTLRKDVALAVQDLSPFPAGSYTGAVSTRNLEGLNVQYAIVGHSERRRYFEETVDEVAKKVDQSLEAGITPIVCVDRGEIQSQAAVIDESKYQKLILAYEPHEYIGTGKIQAVDEILEQVKEVKAVFGDVPVLYGASVNSETMEHLISKPEIAGFLVGSASLDAEEFAAMVK